MFDTASCKVFRRLATHLCAGQRIADEAALHVLSGCKGSSGLKSCMLCWNCINENADYRECVREGSDAVYSHNPDFSKFKQYNVSGIMTIVEALHRAREQYDAGNMTWGDVLHLAVNHRYK